MTMKIIMKEPATVAVSSPKYGCLRLIALLNTIKIPMNGYQNLNRIIKIGVQNAKV